MTAMREREKIRYFREVNKEIQTMSTVELRKKLIEKIQKTENEGLLEEAYRLLALETEDFEIYKLTEEQRKAVSEGRLQIKNGKSLTDDQANNEIDEWLSK